jgi:hypothetical protein
MMKGKFRKLELKKIGAVLRELINDTTATQSKIGMVVFEKEKIAAQSHMRRILDGKWSQLTQEDIENILKYIKCELSVFNEMLIGHVDDMAVDPVKPNISNLPQLHPLLIKQFPDIEAYLDIYEKAIMIKDNVLADFVEQRFIEYISQKIK